MRLIDWLKNNRPSRESLLESRWTRPFAHMLTDPNIWHFNRKSVSRGVALGMFFGLSIPFAQAPAAALLAVPARANLPVAALVTFISNPLTTPFIYLGAYEFGVRLLNMQDDAARLVTAGTNNWAENLFQLVSSAPLPTALGLFIISALGAIAGYTLINAGWRARIRQRVEARRLRQLAE